MIKKHMVLLCLGGLLAVILAGCGSSTPEPTPQATIAAMKAEDAKHNADMAAQAKAAGRVPPGSTTGH